ncbi:alpha/beta fold hydrolase [Jongsikchunia kroppenstedtii]|uniref:alpha/beta fold hydrolase n=1 Tax=Jongsikchunia kroppenstedtii TaxID=1121721 RepID=UPI000369137D|nr:alpha/beta fold hydrolase [Jongsikchunia kroppenstedtii]
MTDQPRPTRLRTFTNDGLTFDVMDEGPVDSPVVIALHGFPDRVGMRALAAPLSSAGFRVLAPDQRGYSPGARPRGVENYTVDRLAADILALADQAGVTRFHVLGHDWGATVAWELAGSRADRVCTLTALSVPHPHAFLAAIPRGQIFRSWYMVLFQIPWLPEKLMLLLLSLGQLPRRLRGHGRVATRLADRLASRTPAGPIDEMYALWRERGAPTAVLNWYRAMLRRTSGYEDVGIPTLYVWSTGDHFIGRTAAEACVRYVSGPYRFEVLDGVSHWIPRERPDELAGMVAAHVQRSASVSGGA